jgi:hypothetical protein
MAGLVVAIVEVCKLIERGVDRRIEGAVLRRAGSNSQCDVTWRGIEMRKAVGVTL